MSRSTFIRTAVILAAIPLAACTAEMDRERDIRAPAIEALGPAQSCIQLSSIDRTEVHDDYTIDFHMNGDRIYRNTLPNRCPSLGFEERFAYSTSLSQLCSTDIITVLHSDGQRGTSCGLGQFLPVRINKLDSD